MPKLIKLKIHKIKVSNKKYGFVSVSIGQGFNEIFEGLNVDKIIEGGQTMNPSTEDIVKAVDQKFTNENVFIFLIKI